MKMFKILIVLTVLITVGCTAQEMSKFGFVKNPDATAAEDLDAAVRGSGVSDWLEVGGGILTGVNPAAGLGVLALAGWWRKMQEQNKPQRVNKPGKMDKIKKIF